MGTAGKTIDGKAYVAELDKCDTGGKVLGLVSRTIDDTTLLDRTKNLTDNKLVVKLEARKAHLAAEQGASTRHQECVTMAAARWCELTGKDVKDFKQIVNNNANVRSRGLTQGREQG